MQNKLKTLNSLVSAYYSTTAPKTTALNKQASARSAADAAASLDATRLYNRIVDAKNTSIGKAISIQNTTGVKLRRLGLPMEIGGFYLNVRRIPDAQQIFDDGLAALDAVKQDILAEYPILVESATKRLGSFANEVHIPSASEVVSRFTMRFVILNQPVSVGRLDGVVDEVANRVRADSERQQAEMLRTAHGSLVSGLRSQLSEFIDALRNSQRLRYSQFDKLREEAKRMAELNALDLPEINDLIELTASVSVKPMTDSLTNTERVAIAQRAESVSAKADETLAALGL